MYQPLGLQQQDFRVAMLPLSNVSSMFIVASKAEKSAEAAFASVSLCQPAALLQVVLCVVLSCRGDQLRQMPVDMFNVPGP